MCTSLLVDGSTFRASCPLSYSRLQRSTLRVVGAWSAAPPPPPLPSLLLLSLLLPEPVGEATRAHSRSARCASPVGWWYAALGRRLGRACYRLAS